MKKSRLIIDSDDLPPSRAIRPPVPVPSIRGVYEPQEDSELLLGCVRKLGLKGKLACDMGTGSGILANELAGSFGKVVAVDINPQALKSRFAAGNVEPVLSDLFGSVKETGFDLIVFNSPYLPGNEDARWSCGDGTVLVRFLEQAAGRLAAGGRILLLISSLTPGIVPKRARNLFKKVEIVGEKRLPGFERLFVLNLSASSRG